MSTDFAGDGNATATAEYNFLVDPEAAKVVLEELSPCPIVIVPWETVKYFGRSSHVNDATVFTIALSSFVKFPQ